MNKEKLFNLINQHNPLFASEKIIPFNYHEWQKIRPFVREHIWEDRASINVFLVKGTKHPDYINLSWKELLEKGKRMSLNLSLLETNPDYYFQTDKKLPTMSYIQIDGGDYYVLNDGNHRTCIAKFFFYFNDKTELHGVNVYRHQVDWVIKKLHEDISKTVSEKRLRYIVEPFSRHIAREDSASWMKEIYDPGIRVVDTSKGTEYIMDRNGAETFLENIRKRGLMKRLFYSF